MKKTFLVLKSSGDYIKLFLCLAMCVYALYLLFAPEESVTVFSNGDKTASGSLYGLLGSYL